MEVNADIHEVYDDVLYVPEEVAEKKEEALPKVGRGRPFPKTSIYGIYHAKGLIKY